MSPRSDARDRLLKHGAGAALEIDPEAQALALRLLPARQKALAVRNVHGHRLGAEDVLAGIHRRRRVHRMVIRRSLDHHRIELGLRQFAVCVGPQ